MRKYHLAIVGATGAVGSEILQTLERRRFPYGEIRLLASARSVGKKVAFGNQSLTVQELRKEAFEGLDFALFSAGASRSREFIPAAREAGVIVIDNSSAFRMDPQVPLVVPEVNGADLHHHNGLIANPNCCAAILAVALWPLHVEAHIKRLIISTYQSASGAGAQAMAELEKQTRQWVEGKKLTSEIFPHPIAFNLFSHNSVLGEDGLNDEERKVAEELSKILHQPDLPISVTCIRVPVFRAHSASVLLETQRPLSPERARRLLDQAPGIQVVDNAAKNHFPMPIEATGQLDVLVGRLRRDPSHPRALSLFLSGDQLLKGAAWNAVQIAEELIKEETLLQGSEAMESANPTTTV